MDEITSVSKGVFLFRNGFSLQDKKLNKRSKTKQKAIRYNELWYESYNLIWNKIEQKIEDLNKTMFSKVLDNLLKFVKQPPIIDPESIPTAAILTGINLPDHATLFNNLKSQIKSEITPLVAILYSDDCSSLKSLTENLVYQLIVGKQSDVSDSDLSDESDAEQSVIKKSQCTFATLADWYYSEASWVLLNTPKKKIKAIRKRKSLVVILPDFESLSPSVLQDFILITSSYLYQIPFVLIFGVATSLDAIHKSLPFKVSSKLTIEVFQSERSITYLNTVVENVFLNPSTCFYLTGKPFKLLTDVFLFYDFSVNGFILGVKFALLEHFFGKNYMALSAAAQSDMEIDAILKQLSHEDLEDIRHLRSFRPYVESQSKEAIIKLLEDDRYLKNCLKLKIKEFSSYLYYFHTFLLCLHSLTANLPKNPLGKQLRELYATAVSTAITNTNEYKECLQILNFLSKDELLSNISNVCELLMNADENCHRETNTFEIVRELKLHSIKIEKASFEVVDDTQIKQSFDEKLSRSELKQKLLERSKQEKKLSEFDVTRNECLEYMTGLFEKYLKPPYSQTFFELFFYDDIISLKSHMVGSPRAAIHTALNNPNFYLQCTCCELESTNSIIPTMPDLSIVYKLHLECGKLINMYDWLQAFITIIDPQETSGGNQNILPELQARFTRAVSELQFLGFIKTSKRKTDHVQRLTWGGC